ncbi:hypothetical protein RJ639_018470 [Escallonia herrerae]|uniref:Helicase ATP-binding domain-containing protein n=1 Tax=Escallonia herrerae TaxID=1293975 RepID=A0AA89AI21_9ASTE|nr:hypothetical protein RJ639_018470 [Escallonia herrerae]
MVVVRLQEEYARTSRLTGNVIVINTVFRKKMLEKHSFTTMSKLNGVVGRGGLWMPDHVDPLRNLLDSTRRCCSLLSGLVSSFVSGHYPVVVGALLGSSSKQGNHSGVMADTHYIEVSSTDSDSDDWDLEKYRNLDATPPRDTTTSSSTTFLPSRASAPSTSLGGPSAFDGWDTVDYGELHALPPKGPSTSTNARILPPWASNPGTSLMGRREPQHKVRSASYGSSSNFNTNRQAKPQMHIARNGNSMFPTGNGNVAEPIIVSGTENIQQNSRKGGMQTHDTLKRTLPTSLQPSVSSGRPSNLVENVGSNQFRDSHAKSYQSAWPTSSNGMNLMKDQFSMGGDDVVMYDNKGSRVLPSSLMHTKSFATTKHVSSSDPGYRPGVGEEIHSENDERLVYQAAVQVTTKDLHQPKTEASLPEGLLSVPLLRHQKIALQWMQQKEGSLKNTTCLGGILADDQGLGKTISMIALIQYQRSLESKPKPEDQCIQEAEALNLDDDDGGGTSVREIRLGKPSAGTLVVCPASVLRQWARELEEKVADEAKLSVLVYHGGNRTKDPVELASHDVVLTTYSIVTNEVPKLSMVSEEGDDQKNGDYGLSSDFSSNKKRKQVPNASKSRKKGRKGVDNSAIDSDCGTLARVRWLRVILDEAQTIKNHRTQVARACCGLKAKKRWCLSGTPIQNAIDELFSYFRFLRYDPYTKYKSFYNTIKVPIAKDSNIGYMKLQAVLRGIMLRRTKGDFFYFTFSLSWCSLMGREEGGRGGGDRLVVVEAMLFNVLNHDHGHVRCNLSACLMSSISFCAYAAAGTLNQNYANILLLLLRLRQACDHPLLVKGFSTDSVGRDSFKMAKKLPRDMLINLAKHLDTSFAICDVCSVSYPEHILLTLCNVV